MPATIVLTNAALNLIFGATTYAAKPSTLHFALFTSTPTVSGGGTEVSGSNYSRKAVTANTTNFTDPATAGQNCSNAVDIIFPRATGAWGTVTAIGFYDAATGGNLLWFEPINTPTDVGTSQTIRFAVGAIELSFGGQFGNVIEQRFMRHLLRGTAWTAISTHYFALGTGADETGLTGEPSIGVNGYARKSVANSGLTYSTATVGTKYNAVSIAFANATGAWGAGALSKVGIYDAATGGNLLWYGDITNPITVTSGVFQWNAVEFNISGIG